MLYWPPVSSAESFRILRSLPLDMKWKEFCNITALAFGAWQTITSPSVEQVQSMNNAWQFCPNTHQRILATNRYKDSNLELEKISDHLEKYSCMNRTYSYMKYVPHDCQLRTTKNSLHKIDYVIYHTVDEEGSETGDHSRHHSSHTSPLHIHYPHSSNKSPGHNHRQLLAQYDQSISSSTIKPQVEKVIPLSRQNRFVYIGDSLSAQTFIAGTCLIEQFGYQQDIQTTYIPELWLRPDIPCDPSCIDNPALYSKHNEMFNVCGGCYKGKYRPFEVYSHHPRFWYERIPNDTLAVVMGNGAWYNGYKGVIDSNKVYEETMVLIKPFLEKLINNRNVSVFWVSLPPTANDGKAEYEWMHFRLKDSIVKKHLVPIGVNFIDEMELLNERKLKDPNINPDGFHWW